MSEIDFGKEQELLKTLFDMYNVPEGKRDEVILKFHIEMARTTRPKWNDRRLRGGELALLTAPAFLKRVHPDFIAPDGTVYNEVIRAIDPELMRSVESYIANRKSRLGKDLGDANGLLFILAQPSKGNRRSNATNPTP